MFNRLLNDTATSVLERTLNFTEQRNRVLLNDIANISTPGFVAEDVSVGQFQHSLAKAINRRADDQLPVEPDSTSTVRFDHGDSGVRLRPRAALDNTAFHDRGVRSIANLMTDLAENAEAHQEVAKMLTAQYQRLTSAINLQG